jgi:peptidoglycan/xylan/chitin deacetylase (PgdA/CDA1 family)
MGGIAILTYHSLDTSGSVVSTAPPVFRDQMAWLKDAGYRALSLREAVADHERDGSWPDKSVVVTFDDGYANVHEHALPVLVRCGFSATVFLVCGHVGGWNDWETSPGSQARRPLLSWGGTAELAASGTEIGGHTHTHPDLRGLRDSEVEREMIASQTEIEDRLNLRVESFAYPYGEVSPTALSVAARTYHSACTTTLRRAFDEPLHQLPRVDAYYIRTRPQLDRLATGRLDPYLAWRRWGRSVRRILTPGRARRDSNDRTEQIVPHARKHF